MVTQFAGKKYKLHSSENVDEYLKALNTAEVMRQLAATLTPVVELIVKGDTYTLMTYTSIKDHEVSFKLGEEFEQNLADGRKVMTIITQDGNKLVEVHKGSNPTTIVREFSNDQIKITLTAGNVVATRIYKPE